MHMLKDSPRLYPGVVDLVRKLQGRVRLAVVSGTWRENIKTVLAAAGLADAFETIVGKEDVTAVKPAPEAYQLALKRLRLSARSTVAIEDSPSGIAAARAAGIRAIAVGHRRPFGDWVGDATYISGFEPVEGLLQAAATLNNRDLPPRRRRRALSQRHDLAERLRGGQRAWSGEAPDIFQSPRDGIEAGWGTRHHEGASLEPIDRGLARESHSAGARDRVFPRLIARSPTAGRANVWGRGGFPGDNRAMTPHDLTPPTGPAAPRRFLPVLLVLFVGSGCAALIYEVVWLQLLQLVIGSTAVSLGVLLGTFMGGMCLGSLLLPRLVSGRRHPLRVYALLELGIGAIGLVVLFGMPSVEQVYARYAGHGPPGILLRGAVAGVCLLPPTLLMGATLPAIARWVETGPEGVSWLGFFYGGNIAGAVFGCLLAGFYLLRVYDMATATYVAFALNVTVAAIALALAAAPARYEAPADPATREHAGARPAPGPCIWRSPSPGCRRSVPRWSGPVCSR